MTATEAAPNSPNRGGRPTAARRLELDQRRMMVAERVIAHTPYRVIAAELGVAVSTVSDDVKQVKRLWHERSAATYQARIDEEDGKLDALERVFIARALNGNEESAAVVLRLMERRAKLLGLDRPTRVEAFIAVSDYQTKVDGELEEMLAVAGAELVLDVSSTVHEQ